MKLIQLIISVLLTSCAAIMLYGAVTKYCPMKEFNISITLLLLAGCLILNKLTYKEFKAEITP